MKASNIKFWARSGQIAFFSYNIFGTMFEMQLPKYVSTEWSGTIAENIYAWLCGLALVIFSEAIVKLIGYFAELLEERKQ